MPKTKFYYDTEALTYRAIKRSLTEKILRMFIWLVVIVTLMYLGFFGLSFTLKSPKVNAQEREIENLKFNYKILASKVNRANKILDDISDRDDNIYRVYFGISPVSRNLINTGLGGINRYDSLDGYKYSKLVKILAREIDIISKRLVIQSRSLDTIVGLAKNNSKRLASIPAIQPVSNKDLKRMASGYGYRIHPIYKIRKFHPGMDFSAPKGTPVYATGDGKVTMTKIKRTGYGKHIKISHRYGYQTLYAHLDKILVRRGQKVKRGDLIGRVGSSGTSTANHLHYEVRSKGKHVNPVYFYHNDLTPEQYDKMIMLSSQENQSFD